MDQVLRRRPDRRADGTISVNNENAVAALEMAKSWVGTISPDGVLAYQEEEARGIWQTGNAVFMRNWPYAYTLGNGGDSAVKDQVRRDHPARRQGRRHLGRHAGRLERRGVEILDKHQEAAISLALYLAGPEAQKHRAIAESNLPTIVALYDDADIAAAQPIIPQWKDVFLNAVPRPSAPTLGKYNEVSAKFWSAVHQTLSGEGTAAENLELLEVELTDIKGSGW
jgi:trehalose/maltose transport system substrate-binding protein